MTADFSALIYTREDVPLPPLAARYPTVAIAFLLPSASSHLELEVGLPLVVAPFLVVAPSTGATAPLRPAARC